MTTSVYPVNVNTHCDAGTGLIAAVALLVIGLGVARTPSPIPPSVTAS